MGSTNIEVITTFNRNQSRKSQKRVNFRLPEQDDIITYDSLTSGSAEMETNKKK